MSTPLDLSAAVSRIQEPAPMESEAAETQTRTAESIAELVRTRLAPDSWLRQDTFLLENWQWLGLLLLVALGVVVERLSVYLLRRIARQAARSGRVKLDESRLTRFVRPVGVVVTWWVFVMLLPALRITNESVEQILSVAASLVLSVAAVVAAWRLVDMVCDALREKALESKNKFDDILVPMLRRTLKIFVVVVAVAYVGSAVTDDFWKVVAGMSIGTAVLAFAFKDSLENIFGTFTVLLDKPFQLGDWITVGEVDGTVEHVGFRSTRVRTFYNSLISVPNRHFISAKVDNWGARRYRRIKQTLGLAYDTPPEKIEAFCEALRELIRRHPYTRKDYYHVYLNAFGESSLDVLLYCFVETPDWAMELRERHRLMADILRVAERLGVAFAFPSRSVYMVSPESLEHADRPGSDPDGAKLGRRVGEEVAAATLAPFGKDRPGRVKFVRSTSPLAAPGGEGDGS